MGVKLLPPRLYKSELAKRESLRDTLLLVELDTAGKRKENHNSVSKQILNNKHII